MNLISLWRGLNWPLLTLRRPSGDRLLTQSCPWCHQFHGNCLKFEHEVEAVMVTYKMYQDMQKAKHSKITPLFSLSLHAPLLPCILYCLIPWQLAARNAHIIPINTITDVLILLIINYPCTCFNHVSCLQFPKPHFSHQVLNSHNSMTICSFPKCDLCRWWGFAAQK